LACGEGGIGEGGRDGIKLLLAQSMRILMVTKPTTDSIWTRLSADLRQFICRRVSDDHVADDLLQETFVRVHRNLPSLQEADRLAAWVYQIARNVIHDHHRQATKTTLALVDDPADEMDDHLSCLKSRSGEWLEELIRQLPDGYREAVQLSEIEGLPQQEVAERLGLSLSGAKSRIQRGRLMLKDELERCCRFEFDRRGNVMDYEPRPDRTVCRDCGE
jgi:RNA polymerase sigma-70 factor (ECF subfamily)